MGELDFFFLIFEFLVTDPFILSVTEATDSGHLGESGRQAYEHLFGKK